METTMSEPGIGRTTERTSITDSFHWDVYESLGVLALRLREDNTYEQHPSRPHAGSAGTDSAPGGTTSLCTRSRPSGLTRTSSCSTAWIAWTRG